jgi:hypothetical protein
MIDAAPSMVTNKTSKIVSKKVSADRKATIASVEGPSYCGLEPFFFHAARCHGEYCVALSFTRRPNVHCEIVAHKLHDRGGRTCSLRH